jgi:tetratricopeptide (TPR) repeat protein
VIVSLSSRDPWLQWALRVVGLLVIGAIAFLAYTVWQGERQAKQGSLASRAIANLEEQVRKDPQNPDYRVILGDALRDIGSHAAAIEQYEAALELAPDNPGAMSGLAIVAMNRQEWRTAEGYWQQAIEILSKNKFAAQDLRLEKAYYYYGVTLMQVAEYEDAIAYLKEALRIKRSDADTHYALAVAYREIGSIPNQRRSLEAALAFVPSMPEANYDLGLLLVAEGDEAGAAALFRRAADNFPRKPEPLAELEKLGPYEDRMAAAESLAATDREAALLEARVALALQPDSVDAARLVARLLQQLDQPEEAKAAWNRVLDMAPGDSEATEALKVLGGDA